MSPVLVFVIAGVFGLLGGFFIVTGIRNKRRASASLQWPSAAGTINSSQLVSQGGGRSGRWYKAQVTYTFSVNGQTYTSDKVVFGDPRSQNMQKEQAVVSRYTQGAPVNVFYNPLQPAEAVLQREVGGANTRYIIVGGLLVFMAVFVLAMWVIGMAQG